MSESGRPKQPEVAELKNERPSFNQWLAMQGVDGKSENDVEKYKTKPIINYLFLSDSRAKNFIKAMSIEPPIYLNDQVVYPHSLSNKQAIIITPDILQELEDQYDAYIQKQYPYTKQEIQEQFALIQARIDAHSAKRVESDYNKIHLLASNQDDSGWTDIDALMSYNESIANYKALYRDQLNQEEVDSLDYFKFVNDCIIHHQKLTMIEKTPEELQNESEQVAQDALELLLKDNDAVIFQSGKYEFHAAYVVIVRKGPDYFYTEYNAGLDSPLVAASHKEEISGVHFVVVTRIIQAKEGESLEEAVVHIIKAENEALYYQSLEEIPKEGKDRILACDLARYERLSKEIAGATKGYPQRSGNCTIMSLKLLSDSVAPMLSEDHYRFMKGCDDPLQLLNKKKEKLQAQLEHFNVLAPVYPQVQWKRDGQQPPIPIYGPKAPGAEKPVFPSPKSRFFTNPKPSPVSVIPMPKEAGRRTPLNEDPISVLRRDKVTAPWEKLVLGNPAKGYVPETSSKVVQKIPRFNFKKM